MSVDSPAAQPATPDSLIEQCLSRRSGGVGADRQAELAQGLQRRLQVRRQARRSGGSDAGHLPEDFQGAGQFRSTRELPDLDHQHQPEPLHRPLPQRAEGAADDRARGRHRAICSRHRPIAVRIRPRSTRTCAGCCDRRCRSCRRRFGRQWSCATSRSCRTRKSPIVSGYPRARSSRASIAGGSSWLTSSGACRTSSQRPGAGAEHPRVPGPGVPESPNEPHNRTRKRNRGRARRRVTSDVPPSVRVLDGGHASSSPRARSAWWSTFRRSATWTARPSAA